MQDIFLADTKRHAQNAYQHFIDTYSGLKYPKAAECLSKGYDNLFRFYDYPAEHWVHIRTSNPIESMFATVRLRYRSTKGNDSADAILTMVFKFCKEAEKNWRQFKGFEKLQLAKEDKTFIDRHPFFLLNLHRRKKIVFVEPCSATPCFPSSPKICQ
ncbi:MAG: transposase [Spirochaetales bacterium]|nr:transposase [Spirochaetales bacterium]